MKKFLKYTAGTIVCIFSTIFSVSAFIGLTAENGDILSITKWNELVVELSTKLSAANIIAGTNITLSASGSNVTINSDGGVIIVINSNRDDNDLSTTRYYGVEYSNSSWKIDREIGSGTGTVRTTATQGNNAGFVGNYSGAWSNRATLNY